MSQETFKPVNLRRPASHTRVVSSCRIDALSCQRANSFPCTTPFAHLSYILSAKLYTHALRSSAADTASSRRIAGHVDLTRKALEKRLNTRISNFSRLLRALAGWRSCGGTAARFRLACGLERLKHCVVVRRTGQHRTSAILPCLDYVRRRIQERI